jgi:hypothetical protein
MRLRETDRTPVQDPEGPEPSIKSQVASIAVREQLKRILSDPLFQNRKRLSEFLRYIVEQSLAGHQDALKERIIGIEVFERRPDFDTNIESIVRVTATELRKRLARYYENPDHAGELRIDVPARSYVSTFEPPKELSHDPHGERIEKEPRIAERTVSGRAFRKVYLLLPVGICLVFLAVWVARGHRHQPPAIDQFWAPVVSSGGSNKVLISIAQPSGMLAAIAQKPASPVSGSEISLSKFIAQQANYPIADLSAADAIVPFLSHRGKEAAIRLAGSIALSDLHAGPVVLLGSGPNQWTVRLGADLRFRFQTSPDASVRWIEDSTNPTNRSWSLNVSDPYDKVTSEYVLITRSFAGNTGQWWIGVCGLTVLGTIAGQQMLIDPNAMETIANQLPKGWDRKNLQMVIGISMFNGSPGASHVVAYNIW